METEFRFFTREEEFKKFYGESYNLEKLSGDILGFHQQRVWNLFFFKYGLSSIALNLSVFSFIEEDKLAESISKTIQHEFIHECLTELYINMKYHHWATNKLGLDGF